MSKHILVACAFVAFVAACAQQEEPVVMQEPVTTEPVFTGKYGG